jgi:hypothetical protein
MWLQVALVVGAIPFLTGCARSAQVEAESPPYESCRPRLPDVRGQQSLAEESAWELPQSPPIIVGPGRVQVLYEHEPGTFSVHEFRPRLTTVIAATACPAGLRPARLAVTPSGDDAVVCNSPDPWVPEDKIHRPSEPARVAYGLLSPHGSFEWKTFSDSDGNSPVEGFVDLEGQVAVLHNIPTHTSFTKSLVPTFKLRLVPGLTSVELWSQHHVPGGLDEVLVMFLSDRVLHVVIRELGDLDQEQYFDVAYSLSDGALATTELGQGNVEIVPGRLVRPCVAGGMDHGVSIAFPIQQYVDANWPEKRIGQVRFPSAIFAQGLDAFPSEQALCPPEIARLRQGDKDGWRRASFGKDGWIVAFPGEPLCKDHSPTMRILWSPALRSSEAVQSGRHD